MSGDFNHVNAEDEFYFQWHLTERCNLRCKHCYHTDYRSKNELNFEQILEVLDLINEAGAKWGKLVTLSLTGGEPLLRRQELLQLITSINEKKFIYYFDLLTNGTLLDNDTANFLAASPKLRRVQVSLEGPDSYANDQIRGEGNFSKVQSAIPILKDKAIQVSIMTTLNKHNLHFIREMVESAVSLQADFLSFERFIPEGNGLNLKENVLSSEELREAFNLITDLALKEHRLRILTYRPLFCLTNEDAFSGAMCSVGTNALTIMHDGSVFPCRRLPISLGNILKDGLFKIWYDSPVLWQIRDCRNLKGKCRNCIFISSCRGCRAMAFFTSGDYLAEDPQCWNLNQRTVFI